MKLTILFLTTFLIQVSAAGLAQNVSFVKRNASLKELFTEIRRQTGYNVFWQEGKVNDALKFNAEFNTVPLTEVLDKVLESEALEYKIVNQTIVVKQKDVSFLNRINNYLSAINVTGKITDGETGQPIPNVTVTLKGTKRSVSANERGVFEFSGLPDNAVLVFTSIGYVEQSASARETMEITMTAAAQTLEDVTVSTGYQQLRKGSTTGAFSVVTSKDIENTPSVNLLERLEGKVPGVQFDIRNNSVQIRGISSYNAIPPLVIIDGFPSMNQDLTTISSGTIEARPTNRNQPSTSGNAILSTFNPADIESITFLKDAAASAIWGAKAANGVIVITTKRGRKGKSSIDFNATVGTSAPANFSNLTTMTNAQYIELEQELVDKNFIQDPVANLIASPLNGYRTAPVTEAMEWMFAAKRNPARIGQRDSALNVLAKRSNRDQLREYLLQPAVTQQYNLSFSGGAGNSSYRVSGNYTKDRPVFKSNEAEKYSLVSNLTNEFLNKRLVVTTDVNYGYSRSQVNSAALQGLSEGVFGYAPYEMLVDANGNRIRKGVALTTRASDSLTRVLKLMPWTYNAIDELDYNNTVNIANTFRINSSVKGIITSWLTASVSGQIQKGIEEQVNLQNENSYASRNLINTGSSPQNVPVIGTRYGFPKGGVYNTSKIFRDDYAVRAQLDVNKDFGDRHHFDMLAGTELRQEKSRGSEQRLFGYNEDLSTSIAVNTVGASASYFTVFPFQKQTLPQIPNSIYRNTRRYLSYYGNGSYSYLGKYYVTASARFDDINVLGVSRKARATPLWSAGLRWDIMKEDFMRSLKWVSTLSLRGSYGLSGNNPMMSANFSTVQLGSVDGYTQLPYATIGYPVNQDLGWEITRMTNIGLDAALFDNRFGVSLDLYRKRTSDILISLPINSTYGWTNLSYNVGDLDGHGIDMGLRGEMIRARDWKWSADFNFSYNTNEVKETRIALQNNIGTVLTAGYPVDNLWVYRWAGLDNLGRAQIFAADGSIISSDNNTILPEDRKYAGRTVAPYFGGFGTRIEYKSFSLYARASYNLGNKFMLQTINPSSYPTNGQYSGIIGNNRFLADRWRKPGDEQFTNIPGISNANVNAINRHIYSDLNVRDAGTVRLQQITFSYSVPRSFFKNAQFIKAVNLGATVSNLGLLWAANKEGVDPGYQMTDKFNNLPPTRNYVFNLNVSL